MDRLGVGGRNEELATGRWEKLQLAAAVFEFTVLRDGKPGGVGGGDAVPSLHAVVFLHLR